MKKVWVRIDKWNKDLVIAAIEGGADALVLPDGYNKSVAELGKITTVAKDGNLVPDADLVFLKLKSVEDENKIMNLSKTKIVVVECVDWKIIPLENIIARGGKNVIVQVENLEDALLAFGILESGVGGVLIQPDNIIDLKKILGTLTNTYGHINLSTALVESISNIGIGDRVCVDTCTSIQIGNGMLVGNSSTFLFLMHAENIKNPYVELRPFRINAGAVHAYTRVFDDKTRYLYELSTGDTIMITNYCGHVEKAVVGRIKIERRPLLLIRAVSDGRTGTTIVQNAETIRLVSSEGVAKSVVELQPGDEIVVSVENSGRHFGYKVEEYIEEK